MDWSSNGPARQVARMNSRAAGPSAPSSSARGRGAHANQPAEGGATNPALAEGIGIGFEFRTAAEEDGFIIKNWSRECRSGERDKVSEEQIRRKRWKRSEIGVRAPDLSSAAAAAAARDAANNGEALRDPPLGCSLLLGPKLWMRPVDMSAGFANCDAAGCKSELERVQVHFNSRSMLINQPANSETSSKSTEGRREFVVESRLEGDAHRCLGDTISLDDLHCARPTLAAKPKRRLCEIETEAQSVSENCYGPKWESERAPTSVNSDHNNPTTTTTTTLTGQQQNGSQLAMIDYAYMNLVLWASLSDKRSGAGDAISHFGATLVANGYKNCASRANRVILCLLLWAILLLAAALQPAPGQVSALGTAPATPPAERAGAAKLELWLRLVQALAGEPRGPAPSPEELARQLAGWPDQKRAALVYLDLLARKQANLMPADPTINSTASQDMCIRASLAELTASSSQLALKANGKTHGNTDGNAESAHQMGVQLESADIEHWASVAARLSLNEIQATWWSSSEEEDEEGNRLDAPSARVGGKSLIWRLNQETPFADLAKLAVENANLISRLLIHPESGIMRRTFASPKFFKYLLESKLSKAARDWPQLYALGLVFLEPSEVGVSAGADNPFGALRAAFGPLAIRPEANGRAPLLLDLAQQRAEARNAYFGRANPQAFALKWARSTVPLRDLALKLQLGTKSELGLADGRWFSPYFDCGLTNRWLLTYSVPFFASTSGPANEQEEAAIKLR